MDLTSTLYQTLYASAAMFIVALIVLIMYSRSSGSKSRTEEGDKNETYLGGEEHPYDQQTISSTDLFWSVANQSLKNVYKKIVNRFQTYSIDSWLFFMGMWLAFLIVLLIILVGIL
jgi:hypothetical protein